MSGKKTDNTLLYKIRFESNPDAFGELYDRYVKQIYRFVYFKVSNHEEAEDLTSEVFLKAWNYLQEKKEVASFRGLLYRIARNAIIDLYRTRATRPEALSDEEMEVTDDNAWYQGITTTLESEKIIAALKNLKQEYQEVITLRYIDELEVSEIADIVGKGHITVRVTLHRALKKLKDILDEN